MRLGVVRTIFRKELLDTLRDRRTIVAMVVIPILLYPALLIFMGRIFATDIARLEARTPVVVVWGEVPDRVVDRLADALEPDLRRSREIPPDPEAAAQPMLGDESVQLVVLGPPEERDALSLVLLYNETKRLSQRTFQDATEVLAEVERELLAERAAAEGLPEGFVDPLQVAERDLALPEERAGEMAGRLLPMLLLIMVFIGATYPAIDVTAGEKERGTMQTLLCAPVRSVEVIAGKYLSVVVVAVASAALNLVGMGFAVSRQAFAMGPGVPADAGFSLQWSSFLTIFVLLLPVAFLAAAVLMITSVFARTFREAQNYSQPVFIAAVFGGMLGFTDTELTPAMALVPFVNIVMVVRDVFRGASLGPLPYLVFVANAGYAAVAVFLASRVFDSEQVLLGGERPWRDLRGRRRGPPVPTPRSTILFVLILLLVLYYGSFLLPRFDFAGQGMFLQLGLLLLPALAWILLRGHSFRETLYLRLPSRRSFVGILLVSAGGWTASSAVLQVQTALFPEARQYAEALSEYLGAGVRDLSFPLALFVLAVLPALSEEAVFRGVILSGLRSSERVVIAVLGSALLFGAFHLAPFHILPTAVIGVVLAVAVLTSRSLLAGILPHAVNNALAVLVVRDPDAVGFLAHPLALAGGGGLLVVGLAILVRSGKM